MRHKKKVDHAARRAALCPPGTTRCYICCSAKPDAEYVRRDGKGISRYCLRCRGYRAVLSRQRKWHKSPKGRLVLKRHRQGFLDQRPHHEALYRLRYRLGLVWKHGSAAGKTWLEEIGYRHADSCEQCGSTLHLMRFWPDYGEPTVWMTLCAIHRKTAQDADTRTPEQMNAQLGPLRETMRELYKTAGTFLPKRVK